jgi:esterase/lipase
MIWDFENLLSRRLMAWAGLNILVGAGLALFGEGIWPVFGLTAIVWGAVNGLIALFGLRKAGQHLFQPSTDEDEVVEAARIRKILWINNALDVLYVAGGTALLYFLGQNSLFWRGAGWGTVLQGAFLFGFDLWHARRVPEPYQLPHLPLFTHPDHQPFWFEGEKPAALLVHGFPGSALEMRHLGKALNEAGWMVRGVLLPGFGSELPGLIRNNNDSWVQAVGKELERLRSAGHTPILLVGYSFGGAVSMQVAAGGSVDGLVLISPMTWKEPAWTKPLLDFVRAMLPLSITPLKHIPLDNPLLEEELFQYQPEFDKDDPDQVSEMRRLEIPLMILDQLREVGREGLAAAPLIYVPTLVIQGEQDKVIPPKWTKDMAKQLPNLVSYVIVEGSHSLTMPRCPSIDKVLSLLVSFAGDIKGLVDR